MAKTTIATGDATTKKLYDEKLFRDTMKEVYFMKFAGEGDNNLMQVKNDLAKSKGDRTTITLVQRLNEDGYVTSGQTLEGNEQALTNYTFDLTLEQYRVGVRDNGAMDRQRPAWDMSSASRSAIITAGAELMDKLAFNALKASPTATYSLQSGTFTGNSTYATAKDAITTSDKLSPELITKVKSAAITGRNRAQTPLRPIKVGGKNYFVLLVHPDVLADLSIDSTWSNAAMNALPRSEDNPIFSGAKYLWNGVVIHEHENIEIGTDAGVGSDVPYALNAFMGAQALAWAWGQRPELVVETFDYKNEIGYGWGIMAACAKPSFNSQDYGAMSVLTARGQYSDLTLS